MYRSLFARTVAALALACSLNFAAAPLTAQSGSADSQHQQATAQGGTDQRPQHDLQHTHVENEQGMAMPSAREGSGTSWLPDETPMYAVHGQAGDWMLMAHRNAFLQYLHETGERGSHQTGSINWFMGMADRSVGAGHLGLRAMISLEPWTIRGCGYPDLLASGEVCQADAIHDRQHPHDLFMEVAATYDRPLVGALRLQLYGGPVGEPALGPTAFPHLAIESRETFTLAKLGTKGGTNPRAVSAPSCGDARCAMRPSNRSASAHASVRTHFDCKEFVVRSAARFGRRFVPPVSAVQIGMERNRGVSDPASAR